MPVIIDQTDFKIAAFRSSKAGDDYFNGFPFVAMLSERKYSDLIKFGLDLLSKLKSIDNKAYFSIHKGTPFYWMGVAAFLSNDFSSAINFFDAAVSEDLRTKRFTDILLSPSILFALLDDSVPNQAARDIVTLLKSRITEILNIYNLHIESSQSLTFHTIREELFRITLSEINHPWRSLYTSFISFFGEFEYQKSIFSLKGESGSYEFCFKYLFGGCLLFESLLKENQRFILSTDVKTLSSALKKLQTYLDIEDQYIKINDTNLPDVLDEIDKFQLQIPNSILITGKLRNTIGHNLVWSSEIRYDQFEKLFFAVAFACLHAVNCLYKQIES